MSPRIEVIGNIVVAAPWIPWARKKHFLSVFGRNSIGSNIIIEIMPNYIRIFVYATTGIITHPRSGTIEYLPYQEGAYNPVVGTVWTTKTRLGIKGGWTDGETPLTTDYIYPLVDEDDASFLLDKDGDTFSGEFLGDLGNYGNLHWIGTDNTIVSWKGTPTRHFQLSELINIPGFSTHHKNFVGAITGEQPRYSAFGPNIYIEGEIIEGPKGALHPDYLLEQHSVVLGAAISEGILYCVAAGSKADTAKTYLQLWKQSGDWTLLYEIEKYGDDVVNLPWFADSAGTSFTCVNGATISAAGFVDRVAGTGTAALTVADYYPQSFSFNGSYPLFHEPGVQAVVSFSAGGSSTRINGDILTKDFAEDGPIWQLGTDPEVELSGPSVLTGTGSYPNIVTTAGQTFTASGGTAPFSWSAGFVFTVSGDTSSISTSGGDKVCGSVTVTVTDACGKIATLTVRAPNGQWVQITDVAHIDFSTSEVPSSYIASGYTFYSNSGKKCVASAASSNVRPYVYAYNGSVVSGTCSLQDTTGIQSMFYSSNQVYSINTTSITKVATTSACNESLNYPVSSSNLGQLSGCSSYGGAGYYYVYNGYFRFNNGVNYVKLNGLWENIPIIDSPSLGTTVTSRRKSNLETWLFDATNNEFYVHRILGFSSTYVAGHTLACARYQTLKIYAWSC